MSGAGRRSEPTESSRYVPLNEDVERQLRPDRRDRRRRPLTRRSILAIRGTVLLTAIFSAAVFSLQVPASSVWRHEALALPVAALGGLVGFTPYQVGQLLGLRPPRNRAR